VRLGGGHCEGDASKTTPSLLLLLFVSGYLQLYVRMATDFLVELCRRKREIVVIATSLT
jgi:hypothetical protein